MSEELDDASGVKNHIVIVGCLRNLTIFVAELRRPLIVNDAYHPIVVMDEKEPEEWDEITGGKALH